MTRTGSTEASLLVRNTGLNLLAAVLPLLVGIVALPIAIRGLGKEAFGILSIAWVVLGYFGLFDFGLARATTKFVAEAIAKREDDAVAPIVGTALLVSLGLGVVGAGVLVALTPYLVGSVLEIPVTLTADATLTFYYLAASLPVVLASTTLRGTLQAAQRFDLVNVVLIPSNIATYLFAAMSLPFGIRLPTVVLLIVVARTVGGGIYGLFCVRVFPSLCRRPSVDGLRLKSMLTYGGWISITNIVSPLLVYMDRFFLGAVVSMTAVTYYAAPYEVLTRLRVFPAALMTTLFPELSAASTDTDSSRIEALTIRAFRYMFILIGMMALVLFVHAPLLLDKWLGPEFVESSLTLSRILAIGVLVNSLSVIPFNLLQAVGRPNLPAIFHLIELPLYVVALAWLVGRFGVDGAAWAWTFRVTLDGLLLYAAAFRIYPKILVALTVGNIGPSLVILGVMGGLLAVTGTMLDATLAAVVTAVALVPGGAFAAWRYVLDGTDRRVLLSMLRRAT